LTAYIVCGEVAQGW